MRFKQIQFFQLTDSFDDSIHHLVECLEKLLFKPCLPSMPISMGWVPLIDEEGAPLTRCINHCTLFCLQIEEKILPTTVIRQSLTEKIKQIEKAENRKIRQKEKFSLKDEIIMTLLPRAFSKLTRVYAYIDSKNHSLILGTTNVNKAEQFLSTFKKSLSAEIDSFHLKKLSSIMTHWLKEKSYPSSFSVEKTCLLQDPQQQNRVIRCQQQDLFAGSIQALIKDGCEVKQLALLWQDQVHFILTDDFSLRSIQFQEDVRMSIKEREPETALQQLDADFAITAMILSGLLKELLGLFIKQKSQKTLKTSEMYERVTMN